MFGKKKQKQETLVRMRNLAQLDEGFFAHMKDGKDMFDATAREIRNTYQQLGAGITQIQENIKEASQMAADNGEKEQELTGQLASYQEQEVQSSEKREQMLQNFAQIEQEMAQLVEENKHFTTPSKFLNEFPVALKAENEKTREELEKMQDCGKQAAELKKAEKRKAEVDGLFAKMYEDWSAGRITEYNFNMLSEKYQNEQKELETKIRQLHEMMEAAVQTAADAEKWIALMKQYVNPVELTAELLNTLIEKITVHEAVKGEDGSREQEVEIYYRFIGKID